MLTEKEITEIAAEYANINKTEHYYLEYLCAKPSVLFGWLLGDWFYSFYL